MSDRLPPGTWKCIDCGKALRCQSFRCLACYKKAPRAPRRKRQEDNEDWSPRLCELAERAAQGIPLFRKSDRPRTGIGRAIQASRPKRYRYGQQQKAGR